MSEIKSSIELEFYCPISLCWARLMDSGKSWHQNVKLKTFRTIPSPGALEFPFFRGRTLNLTLRAAPKGMVFHVT